MSRNEKLDDLFDECVELVDVERRKRVEAVAAEDPDLARELESLLVAHAGAPTFLESPPAEAWAATGISAGDEIAGYRILETLGEGGMGTVFLAEKADLSFEHRVAIKLVRGGLMTPRLVSRFAEEQRILAMLNHPNIARLYDAGVSESGWPYLVMEYVEGVPLIEFCDAHRLSIDERLKVFGTLCAAIDYAHRRLVVHRDLKPSNILVTSDGTPKLLDFGIAKLVAEQEEADEVTRTALRAMTPTYASPEQILGEQITTATDVYGLGIILYELLTGSRPHVASGRPRHEIERRVCHEDPELPSKRLSEVDLEEVAAKRRTTPERLRRRLRGELDTIAVTALRRVPTERYAGASKLGDDLRRHADHLPVLAQRQTVGYRLSRFVRRHRVGVAAAAFAFAMLVAALFSIASGREQARREAEKSQEIATFLTRLFEYANPERTGGTPPTVLGMLDEGARRIRQELSEQPVTRAELQRVMARAYLAAGFFEPAEKVAVESVETLRGAGAEAALADSLHSLALVLRDRAETQRGTEAAEEALAIRRRLFGPDHHSVGQALDLVAMLVSDAGEIERSIEIHREALEIYRAAAPEPDQELARIMNNLGLLLSKHGEAEDHEEAEALLREALEIGRMKLGEQHPDRARAMNNLAVLLRRKGEIEEAEVLYRRTLEMRRAIHPEGHPDVAQSLNNLGAFYYASGDAAAAEELFAQALEMWADYLPDDHTQIASVRTNLSVLARRRGDYDGARKLLDQVLSVSRSRRGDRHPTTLDVIYRIGVVENDQGRYAEALGRLRPIFELQRETLGADARATMKTSLAVATAELGLGRTVEAEPKLRIALTFFEARGDRFADECRDRLAELEATRSGASPP